MVYMNQFDISYTAPMSSKKRKSLKNLLFIHEIAFLFLVAVTGVLGGMSTFFWQETSSESVRINNLIYATEQIRSELFRQIQQVIRAHRAQPVQLVLRARTGDHLGARHLRQQHAAGAHAAEPCSPGGLIVTPSNDNTAIVVAVEMPTLCPFLKQEIHSKR